jgi:guanylate kinase
MLVVLSGPSGVGKDSVIQALKERLPDIHYTVTATTRPVRPGEVDAVSYHFMTDSRYADLLDRGELLAPARVHGYWYGAPAADVRAALEAGEDVLLKIDVQGAMHLRRRLPQAVYIFLAPPSTHDLVERLRSRHTESGEVLERRLKDATFEMEQLPAYDYVVVNKEGCLEDAVEDACCIIRAERLRVRRQPIEV